MSRILAANVQPIERKTVVDSIVDRLRTRILNNELGEGETLRQEAIAETYGVSRMPVRDALRQLEAEGLVAFDGRRAVVSRLNMNEVRELFDLRALIEKDLVRRAIPVVTKADIDTCERHLRASEKAFRIKDVGRWGELNWKFHEALYRPAGRERSLAIAHMLNLNADRYVRIHLSLKHASLERTERDHRRLLEAYASGNVEAAAQILGEHLAHACEALLHAFKS